MQKQQMDSATPRQLMLAKLKESGLDEKDAQKLRLKPLTEAQTAKLLDRENANHISLQLPYYNIDGTPIDSFYRIRFLKFSKPKKATFKTQEPKKYTQPEGLPPKLYIPPILPDDTWQEVAENPDIQILITEGELKSSAACKAGYPCIGLGGVWSWRSKRTKQALISEFKLFKWRDRNTYLIFDSDLANNVQVQKALQSLAKELADLGAVVHIGYLPDVYDIPEDPDEPHKKTGLDDFIVAKGPEAVEDLLTMAEPFSMAAELWGMNAEVIYITNPGFIVVQDTGQVLSPSDFKAHAYSHWHFKSYDGDRLTLKSTAAEWLKWPQRTTLRKVVYRPGEEKLTTDRCYNTWPGWGVEPKRGDIKPWKRLMDLVFAGDKESRIWFERWCAHQLQYPGVKLQTAVLFWGVLQGSGKSLVGHTLGHIFGENYSEIGNAQLHSNNNTWAVNKQFVMIDEIASAERRDRLGDTDLLKKLITQKKLQVNEKYVKNYDLDDCIAYFMTSNNPDAIRIDAGVDRRFFIKEVKDRYSREFYNLYGEWLENGGAAYLFHYLLNIELGDFHPMYDAPLTKDKLEMEENSRTHIQQWIRELLEDPDYIIGMQGVETPDMFTSQQLLHMYDPNEKFKYNANSMSRELKKALAPKLSYPVKVGTHSYRLYVVRNIEKWLAAKHKQVADYYSKFVLDTEKDKSRKNKF